ncbi:DUF4041 domain-containing protein [Guggenheimella bovis]
MSSKLKLILAYILAGIGAILLLVGFSEFFSKSYGVGFVASILGILCLIPVIKTKKLHRASNELKALEEQKTRVQNEINALISTKESELKAKEEEMNSLIQRIQSYDEELTVKYVDTRDYSDISSAQIKNELAMLTLKSKDLIKEGKATRVHFSGNKSRMNILNRQILKNFNTDVDIALMKLSATNVDTTRGKITRAFETTNKVFQGDNIEITHDYLDLRLEELNLLHQYNKKIEEEREIQRAIREQMIEEEKVRREIELEKIKIAKEEAQFRNEQNKLMQYMSKTDNEVEKNLYIEKIKELEEKLALLEKDKENVFNREANTRAGFVYVISNIGSFGENVYKIGMTRRLEPMDRVRELGDASVPFEFDVHALIFSDDAPKLENALHRAFEKKKVNMVNTRREFFNVSIEEIEAVVKENHDKLVDFVKIPEASQYRETLEIKKSM